VIALTRSLADLVRSLLRHDAERELSPYASPFPIRAGGAHHVLQRELGSRDRTISGATPVRLRDARPAERDSVIVGFSWLVPTHEPAAELKGLFVDPEAMRSGVGRALFADLVAGARGRFKVELCGGAS
jgi:hypothetical protein